MGFLVLGRPRPALAGPDEAARAESLFRSGKQALQQGDYEKACPRLAESLRLERAGGTLLALALCYEGWGRKATAWALFQEAEAMAHTQGRRDRSEIARSRAEALERELSFVTVEVEAPTEPGVELVLDGLVLGAAALGSPMAIDAGTHTVEARRAGIAYFTQTLEVVPGQNALVRVPAPAPELGAAAVSSPGTPDSSPIVALPITSRPGRSDTPKALPDASVERATPFERVMPRAVLGIGLVGLFAGGYFGIRALVENGELERRCPSEPCRPELEADYRTARRDAALSNWLVGIGAGATLAGLTWTMASRGRKPAATATKLGFDAGPLGAAAFLSKGF